MSYVYINVSVQLSDVCKKDTMKTKLTIILFLLALINSHSQTRDFDANRVIGVFSQQLFYRLTIVEFKNDLIFDYHIMSERAHRQTSGTYELSGDTIILNSYSKDSDFDFNNKKWIIKNRNQIVISDSLNDKKARWAILERNKDLDSIPSHRSDLALKVDSIKICELSWIGDTVDYDAELKLIIHEPAPSKEPIVIIDKRPLKYDFFLDYYEMKDIESIKIENSDKYVDVYGSRAENGVIFVSTKKPKR